MDRQQAQARLNEVQALYREWLALLPQLEAAQAEWQRAAALIALPRTATARGDPNPCHCAMPSQAVSRSMSAPKASTAC